MTLHPSVVAITGASRGIGAETARRAALRGHAICVNYRSDVEAANAVVSGIRAAGGRAQAVQADISRPEDIDRLFAAVDAMGTLVALVNNAGILERQMRVEAMDAERLQRTFATNVIGTMLCARQAVLRMSTAHGGRGGGIVNVSSLAARTGSPGNTWTTPRARARSTRSRAAWRRKSPRTASA